MPTYIYKLVPRRETFPKDITAAERAIIGRHWEYVSTHFDAGTINVAGRCEDAAFGIIIFEAPTLDAARGLMLADPANAEGVMTADLHEFRLLLVKPPVSE